MTIASRRLILRGALFGVACGCIGGLAVAQPASPPTSPTGKWTCPPCGCAADGKEFDAPGACPECGMPLVPKAAEPKPKEAAPAPPKAGASGGDSVASAADGARGGAFLAGGRAPRPG